MGIKQTMCEGTFTLHLHLGHLADTFNQSDLQQVQLSEEGETIYRCRYSKEDRRRVLTHVELSNEAGHVIVLKVFGKNLFGKPALVKDVETCSSLKENHKEHNVNTIQKCSMFYLSLLHFIAL